MTPAALLTLVNVTKSFQHHNASVTVIENAHASFIQGRSYAITGPSGSGKSTLLHLIAALDTPDKGAILYNNTNINTLMQHEKTRYLNQAIGLVFQSSYCIKELSVLENVMVPGMATNNNVHTIKQKAVDLLDYVGLSEHRDRKPRELSGGQQQRLTLARALINDPAFLIADEPTGNLDDTASDLILTLINTYKKEKNMGIIMSTHDQKVIQLMDEVYTLTNKTLSQNTEQL